MTASAGTTMNRTAAATAAAGTATTVGLAAHFTDIAVQEHIPPCSKMERAGRNIGTGVALGTECVHAAAQTPQHQSADQKTSYHTHRNDTDDVEGARLALIMDSTVRIIGVVDDVIIHILEGKKAKGEWEMLSPYSWKLCPFKKSEQSQMRYATLKPLVL